VARQRAELQERPARPQRSRAAFCACQSSGCDYFCRSSEVAQICQSAVSQVWRPAGATTVRTRSGTRRSSASRRLQVAKPAIQQIANLRYLDDRHFYRTPVMHRRVTHRGSFLFMERESGRAPPSKCAGETRPVYTSNFPGLPLGGRLRPRFPP